MWQKYIGMNQSREDFSREPGLCSVISLVGGGGKTTWMDFLARQAEAEGKNVLVSTTTHLQIPQSGNLAFSLEEVHRLWAMGRYAVIGALGERRLSMPEKSFLEEAMEQADLTLLEADGSKRMPCKVPREHEPVILPQTDLVIAVMGMSAVGRPLREECFCLEEVMHFLGKGEAEILTEEDAARILSSRSGSRKGSEGRDYLVVLNQCDDRSRRESAERIARLLLKMDVEHVVLTSFSEEERKRFERGNEDE